MKIIRSILGWIAPLAIIAAAVAAFMAMGSQPPPLRTTGDGPGAVPVRTAIAERGSGRIELDLDGVVVPLREVTLAAEVGGRVIRKSPNCRGGRFVSAGELLLEIDPRDYELDVDRLEREVVRAEIFIQEVDAEIRQNEETVALARRQVELAHREVERLGGLKDSRVVTASDHDRAIRDELTAISTVIQLEGQRRVLEKRKVRLAEDKLLAQTQAERVQLDLSRTMIRAPFDGMIVDDPVEQDSFVSKGTALVTIEDTSAAEVKTSLRMDEMARIWGSRPPEPAGAIPAVLPAGGAYVLPDVPAAVIFNVAGRRFRWQGVLTRQEGRGLDERTRTLPCRVLVENPSDVVALDRYGEPLPVLPATAPRSMLRGMFVDVQVFVDAPRELVSVPRDAVRPSGDIWVVRDSKLEIIRPAVVHASAGRVAFVAGESGLVPGDHVVVSQLANPYDGMPVKDTTANVADEALGPAARLARDPEPPAVNGG